MNHVKQKYALCHPRAPSEADSTIYTTHAHTHTQLHTQGSGFREAHVGFPLTNTHMQFLHFYKPLSGIRWLASCMFLLSRFAAFSTHRAKWTSPCRAKSSSWEHGSSEQTLRIHHDEVSYCAPLRPLVPRMNEWMLMKATFLGFVIIDKHAAGYSIHA